MTSSERPGVLEAAARLLCAMFISPPQPSLDSNEHSQNSAPIAIDRAKILTSLKYVIPAKGTADSVISQHHRREEKMKLLKSIALAFSVAFAAAPATAQEFRLLSSWDQNYPYNPHILYPFMEGVEEATDGRIKISFNGPEAVPPFEQLEPVGAGVFHFLFTHGAYHLGTTPIMTVADALIGDLEQIRASGVFDELDQHYQQFGLKLVMLPITPEGAYHIILREPVNEEGNIEGRKIRGSLTYKAIVEMLGGVLVVLPASEIYTALDSGLVDGAAWPIIGVLDYAWNEVAGFLLRPGFGINYEPLFMNLDAWNNLNEQDQEAMMKVAQRIEDSWYEVAPSLWQEEEQELINRGMQITEMGEDENAKLRQAWAEGLWALAAEQNPEATQELRTFAESNGLAE